MSELIIEVAQQRRHGLPPTPPYPAAELLVTAIIDNT